MVHSGVTRPIGCAARYELGPQLSICDQIEAKFDLWTENRVAGDLETEMKRTWRRANGTV